MKTTIQKYNKLCDMNLIQSAKYDINDRVQMIIGEVAQMLRKFEDDARAIYWPEKYNKEDKNHEQQ